jgi:hypothetical protein
MSVQRFAVPLALAGLSLVAAAAPVPAAAGPSIRCAGGLVSEGDARLDLLGKCGPPTLEERRIEERWAIASERREGEGQVAVGRKVSVVVESWTYDLGRNAFVHVVTLENGRVTAVERGSYGYRREPAPPRPSPARARCEGLAGVREGDGKLDVLARCGEPTLVDAWEEARGTFVTDAQGRRSAGAATTVRLETWTYDLGRNRLVRFVRFEDGKVAEVTTGSYGYAD